jgi:hypothetical protein
LEEKRLNARRSSIWGAAIVCCLPALVQHNPNGQIPVNSLADPYLVLIRDTVVQNELRLSDDQRRTVGALTDELDLPLWTLRNQSGDQATQLFQELNSTAERRMEQILSAAQRKRLAQIRLSVRGLKALLRDEVAEQLKLSDPGGEKRPDACSAEQAANANEQPAVASRRNLVAGTTRSGTRSARLAIG